jgi:endonuclease-3
MKRAEKARRIGEILDQLYPMPPIPLRHDNAFQLLVAVVLSAQTTDAQVNRVTPALFRRAPTPEKLAAMRETDILALIRSCGLAPSKARNIKRLAQALVDEHGGHVPADMEALEKLPGVGHKTASVVMNQAFGRPAFPVDTHIHRLAARWGLSKAKDVKQTERDLKKLWPPEEWGKRHLQIIYFGREHCPARNHDPAECPICSWSAGVSPAPAGSPARRNLPSA